MCSTFAIDWPRPLCLFKLWILNRAITTRVSMTSNSYVTWRSPSKRQGRKLLSYSAHDANLTGILKSIVPARFTVLNVVGTIIRQSAPKIPLPRRRAPFAVGPIQRTIKDVMSTAVFRQLGALPPPVRDPLLLVFPPHITMATLVTFLPFPTLNPLYHSPNPLLHPIPMPSPTLPSQLITGHNFPLFSPSSRPCLAN